MIPALLDHIWQSTVFAAGIFVLMPLFRNNRASTRFWLWFVASVKFLFPFSLLIIAGHNLFTLPPPSAFAPVLSAIQPAAEPFLLSAPSVVRYADTHFSFAHLIGALWLLGSVSILSFWFLRWIRMSSAYLAAREMPVSAPVPVKLTLFPLEPGLFGIWHPVILLPEGVVESLTGREIEAILAHELCHLRRRDNLLAAAHMLIEAIFWFHPLVWWIGARLIEERERACDESVLAEHQDPQAYAETILKLCRLYVSSPLDCAAGISSSDLDVRLAAIMTGKQIEDIDPAKQLLLAATAAISIVSPLMIGALEQASVAGQYHEAVKAISISSALLRLPSATIQNTQAGDLNEFGKIIPTHRTRHRRPLLARPDRIAIASSNMAGLNQPPPLRVSTPNLELEISEISPISPAIDDKHLVVASGEVTQTRIVAGDDPEGIECRPPQQLPASHVLGPKTCRTKALWAQYRKEGLDIAPDGVQVVSASGLESANNYGCLLVNGWRDLEGRSGPSLSTSSC
jgi:hypothetical protein